MSEQQEHLRRYLTIPREYRLKVLEDNLSALVVELAKDEPKDIGVHLSLPAMMLDVVHELRSLRAQIGGVSLEDSIPPTLEPVESSPVIRVETLPWNGGIPT